MLRLVMLVVYMYGHGLESGSRKDVRDHGTAADGWHGKCGVFFKFLLGVKRDRYLLQRVLSRTGLEGRNGFLPGLLCKYHFAWDSSR